MSQSSIETRVGTSLGTAVLAVLGSKSTLEPNVQRVVFRGAFRLTTTLRKRAQSWLGIRLFL